MLRAVLDANVLASAFLQPRGPSGKILTLLVREAAFELVLSLPILDELKRILRYPRVQKHLHTPAAEIEAHLAALAVLSDVVEPSVPIRIVSEDPDDDRYVEAALEGRAEYLVSGDRHLLDLREYQSVRMVTPRAFLELLANDRHGRIDPPSAPP
jgi:putative PIN family toxin of toxin-antitoxin system